MDETRKSLIAAFTAVLSTMVLTWNIGYHPLVETSAQNSDSLLRNNDNNKQENMQGFSFNYTKFDFFDRALTTISYDFHILKVKKDAVVKSTTTLTDQQIKDLKDIISKNSFFQTNTQRDEPVLENNREYSLTVTLNGKRHSVEWTDAAWHIGLFKIADTIENITLSCTGGLIEDFMLHRRCH
jgi:hypothetical protein